MSEEEDGIAIIGMAGRWPKAATTDALWSLVLSSDSGISTLTASDLQSAGLPPSLLDDPSYVPAAGILDEVDRFAASFFAIPPAEARLLDPQHRIFLECAYHALEHAALDPARFSGPIGVFAGAGPPTYLLAALQPSLGVLAAVESYPLLLANDKDYLATRVSYKLNLRGPSISVQTACSTSLVAVHLACQSLLGYECDAALAGGVSIRVPHSAGYRYQLGGILSPDGTCRPFDAAAAGTVPGNGAGVVVLRRLADALGAGDPILAVIRGSAVNHDGAAKVGYAAPGVSGQVAVLTAALAMAGVAPSSIDYVEAHGTGTALGDPIEVAALTEVYGREGGRETPCWLGSVKSVLGHLDTAAGVTGLITAVLALQHRIIPPTRHFTTPHPTLQLTQTPFAVSATPLSWPERATPRRAGVSSFGMGGTNAHVVLEEAPAIEPAVQDGEVPQVLLLSAQSPSALETMTAQLAAHLTAQPDGSLAVVASTLQEGRTALPYRRTLVAQSPASAARALAANDPECVFSGTVSDADPRPIFLLPGYGAQYLHMGAELYKQEPVFQREMDRCCTLLASRLGIDLRTILYPKAGDEEPARARLSTPAIGQPTLFAVEYALARLWMSWGIQPRAMIGHDIGEYVAACLAEVFSLEDAVRMVAAQSHAVTQLPPGAMLGVGLLGDRIEPLLQDGLSMAADHGLAGCIVGGSDAMIDLLQRQCVESDVPCTRLATDRALQLPLCEAALDAVREQISTADLRPPSVPYISTITGDWITAAEATDAEHWTQQFVTPVRAADAIRTVLRHGCSCLLEVGPGQTFSTVARAQSEGLLDSGFLRVPPCSRASRPRRAAPRRCAPRCSHHEARCEQP
ncbi:MAG: hypothetical protein NVS2B16_33760 [Chloroflexota bacterium]